VNAKKLIPYLLHPLSLINLIFQNIVGIPINIWITNVIFQRLLRINSDAKFQVNFTSRVVAVSKIKIGRNVWKSFALSGNCYIQGGNGIIIGDDVMFGPGVKIISANHNIHDNMVWEKCSPIVVGNRCWIGANAIILPSVELGEDCVVGAGAVVTSSFKRGSTIVGVPGRAIENNRLRSLTK
jgi:acetyltransferase-like isoleucine patch superfamily enzyme